ncbi:aldo/keto reductase [Kineococcus gynurae]|uniref:Aldo/keto reductase n=1 Tax=Kineococcus gynurae TaxID=452979 RepID=A0ABV5LUU8_9ACTN
MSEQSPVTTPSAPARPGPSRWAVLGPGAIARRFATQLRAVPGASLVGVGSSDAARAREFAAEFATPDAVVGGYAEVLASPEVEAVYVATVHTAHARLVLAAIEAGKHVLCEKPMSPNHGTTMAVVDAARRAGVTLVEGYMYLHHPQMQALLEHVRAGTVGTVQHVDAGFAFDTGSREGRLFDVDVAGGGILDVGGYPVSAARAVAAAALGRPAEVRGLEAVGTLGPTGVDEWTAARLTLDGGISAHVRCGVRAHDPHTLVVHGSKGSLTLSDPWTVRLEPTLTVAVVGTDPVVQTWDPEAPENLPYALEARDLFAATPPFSLEDSLATAAVLDRWRAAIELRYPFEAETADIPTVSGAPLRRSDSAVMTYGSIPGLDKPVSRLVMGCDNQPDLAHASAVFDAYVEAGGNTFDTAWIYGMGEYEQRFGRWLTNRGIRDEVVVIVKGAHTPYCDPESLSRQFQESLERQGLDHADIYMMHRDDESVPVGEFVDVLDEHARAGRMTVFGGSNWSAERFDAANEYARRNGRQGFSVLSNHFGLAQAYDVPWAGCRHMTDPADKQWLVERGIPLLPWSSQARGFFARADEADRSDAELVRCYYSPENFERLRRARALGAELGVPATAVALAFVLAQPFPTFALFGPRTVAETRSSLTGLGVELTPEQVRWLDLETGRDQA